MWQPRRAQMGPATVTLRRLALCRHLAPAATPRSFASAGLHGGEGHRFLSSHARCHHIGENGLLLRARTCEARGRVTEVAADRAPQKGERIATRARPTRERGRVNPILSPTRAEITSGANALLLRAQARRRERGEGLSDF